MYRTEKGVKHFNITCVITHTLYIFRIVPLPINKGVFVV